MVLWLWLFRDALLHLGGIYVRADMSVSIVTLAILSVLVLRRAWRPAGGGLRGRAIGALLRPPEPEVWPLATVGLGVVGYLLVSALLDVNILQDALFGLASFGLLGLWMTPAAWRRSWPICLLALATLPFGYHLDTFLGYPLRVATAAAVADGLGAQLRGGGLEAVLQVENRVAQVDLPCSGVKGLWTGSLLLLLAAWLRETGLGRRWWLALAAQSLALVAANYLRVLILAAVGLIWNQPLLAGWLHLPLGVLGFGAACWLGLALLGRGAGPRPEPLAPGASGDRRSARLAMSSAGLSALLLLALVAANLAYRPRSAAEAAGAPRVAGGWAWPAGWRVEPLPLKASDAAWLAADGAAAVERVRFERQGLSGSAILVLAATWRAHHAPERCFQIYGLKLLSARNLMADDSGASIRWMALGDDGGHIDHSAVTWFQSRSGVQTGDYSARIWADLTPRPEPWVLASVLFASPVAAEDPQLRALTEELRQSIAATWQGRNP